MHVRGTERLAAGLRATEGGQSNICTVRFPSRARAWRIYQSHIEPGGSDPASSLSFGEWNGETGRRMPSGSIYNNSTVDHCTAKLSREDVNLHIVGILHCRASLGQLVSNDPAVHDQ